MCSVKALCTSADRSSRPSLFRHDGGLLASLLVNQPIGLWVMMLALMHEQTLRANNTTLRTPVLSIHVKSFTLWSSRSQRCALMECASITKIKRYCGISGRVFGPSISVGLHNVKRPSCTSYELNIRTIGPFQILGTLIGRGRRPGKKVQESLSGQIKCDESG